MKWTKVWPTSRTLISPFSCGMKIRSVCLPAGSIAQPENAFRILRFLHVDFTRTVTKKKKAERRR